MGDSYYIKAFNAVGSFSNKWGGSGLENGQFITWLAALAADELGNVYAVEQEAYPFLGRVQQFDCAGGFTAKWAAQGAGDGELVWPWRIASDKTGNIYVTDIMLNRIEKYDDHGDFVTQWGSYGTGDGEFDTPGGIAVSDSGYVYVTDCVNTRIQKFDLNGIFILSWGTEGSEEGQFLTPLSIAVDEVDNVYVVDQDAYGVAGDFNRIEKFDSNGVFITEWASAYERYFEDIEVSKSGLVYVLGGGIVQKFDGNGTFLGEWGPDLLEGNVFWTLFDARGIGLDSSENVYLACEYRNLVYMFNSEGTFLAQFGDGGSHPRGFYSPASIEIDHNDMVCVVDSGNSRVQKFSPEPFFSYDKAIIVAGRKSSDDILWPATQKCTADAYRALSLRGLEKSQIRYLSHNADLDLDGDGYDDVFGSPTELEGCIKTWASNPVNGLPIGNLVLYLADHGAKNGYFFLDEDNLLDAPTLNSWLNWVQARQTIILEACYSGSFLSALTLPGAPPGVRKVITSTNPLEEAYFLGTGTTSFSGFFWQQVFFGNDLETCFGRASTRVDLGGLPQTPQVELLGSGTGPYAGTYSHFTALCYGTDEYYLVKFFCTDDEGRTSEPKTCRVTQTVDLGDSTPPAVSGFAPVDGSTGVARYPQIRFTVSDTESGVDRNRIVVSVNGEDVSDSLYIQGTPGSYEVRYSSAVVFPLASTVWVTVNAADLDGNVQGGASYSFTITDGVDGNEDGIPDDWYPHITDPGGDPDGDGYTNAEEAQRGTDPEVADAVPAHPDAYEDDDAPEDATWFRRDELRQRHTFHDFGDADWLVFSAGTGTLISIETFIDGVHSVADTHLEVFAEGSYGTALKEEDNPSEIAAVITGWPVPGPGAYYVRVTNEPAAVYGENVFYDIQVCTYSGGPDLTADAGWDQSVWQGVEVEVDGSGSSDTSAPSKEPAWYQWSFVSRPSDSEASLAGATEEYAAFLADTPGCYELRLEVGDDSGNTDRDEVLVTVADPEDAATVYVDFAFEGTEVGSSERPFRTLGGAVPVAPEPGTVKIKGNSAQHATEEHPRITKRVTLRAMDGSIQIGVLGEGLLEVWKSGETGDADAASVRLVDLLLQLAARMNPEGLAPGHAGDAGGAVRAGTTYEPVLPYTLATGGAHAAQADSVLAVRLRSASGIDPGSLLAPVQAQTPGFDVQWQPVREGDTRDLWVIVRPRDSWLLEDVIEVTAGAQTLAGETVESPAFRFEVESEEANEARQNDPADILWQPDYGRDFDTEGMDLTAESNDTAQVSPAEGETIAAPLGEGASQALRIHPEEVYATPQRVWLPIPEGADPDAVRLYYYHPAGDAPGWYPAENVQGWLVPGSELQLTLDGTTYLGFLVNHAGIVQLAIPE